MLSASWRHPRRPAAEEERANDAGLQLQGGGRHLLDLLGEEVPPIGGVARVRAGPVWLRPRHSLEILATCGLLLAVAAAVVTVTRPALAVYLEGDTVHIGSLTLSHPRDNGGLAEGRLYTGPATLLMVSRPGGAVVASAVTFLGGQRGDRLLHPRSSGGHRDHRELHSPHRRPARHLRGCAALRQVRELAAELQRRAATVRGGPGRGGGSPDALPARSLTAGGVGQEADGETGTPSTLVRSARHTSRS